MNTNNKPRDPIISKSGGSGSPKRSDTLNGSPRTKSISGGGAGFTSQSPKDNAAPSPNNPYR